MVKTVTPRDYVAQALLVIKEHALFANNISDWREYSKTMLARASQATSLPDTYIILRDMLRDLGDNHSHLCTVNDQAKSFNNSTPPIPTGQMINDIGYLNIPFCLNSKILSCEAFAGKVQNLIADFDKPTTRGWVIDLRKNCGGNMWPMIAGLGPILGEGVHGFFKYSQKPDFPWVYKDGAAWCGKFLCARGDRPAHRLTRSNMPVAVLTDTGTASSGEAVAVAFIGRPNTFSIGNQTAGLSTGNALFSLPDGAMMALTTSVYVDRTGKSYGGPIVPDETVIPDSDPTTPTMDYVLARALERLTALRP